MMDDGKRSWLASVTYDDEIDTYVAMVRVNTDGLSVMQYGKTPAIAMQKLYEYVESRIPNSRASFELQGRAFNVVAHQIDREDG